MAYSVHVSTLGILQNIYDEESLGLPVLMRLYHDTLFFCVCFSVKISIISQVKAHTLKAAVC